MKKKLTAVIVLIFILQSVMAVYADTPTTYTYTMGVDDWWIRTQSAYMAGAVHMQDLNLRNPEDVVVRNGIIYVADSHNRRIVAYNPLTGEYEIIGEGVLTLPTGVFVTDEGHIYVADREAVWAFDANREVYLEIRRPVSDIFSERTTFQPRRVLVSSRGTIFVSSVGTFEGIMKFDPQGEFLGFFGANPRRERPIDILRDLIDTEAQQQRRLHRIPNPVNDIAIGPNDLIYTVTANPFLRTWGRDPGTNNSIRVLNMAGTNILLTEHRIVDEDNFSSIAVSSRGFIFVASETGMITQYDSHGDVIFSFGGRALTSDRVGLFATISSIYVCVHDYVYVLDRTRGVVQILYPTSFAIATHNAIEAFETGDYARSLELWEDLLVLNGLSRLAHDGRGRALFALGRFDEAREHFRFSFNREEYSDVLWEVRDAWIAANSGTAAGVIVLLIILLQVIKYVNKKTGIITRGWDIAAAPVRNNRLLSDLCYMTRVLRHPIDSFYEIKTGNRGSVLSATIIYLLAFAVLLGEFFLTSFLFSFFNNMRFISPMYVTAFFFLPIFAWVVGNYLVATINEGEGSFRNVYVCTAYAWTPNILLVPFLIVLSHFFTFNESFIMTMGYTIAFGLVAIYHVLMVFEVHQFNFMNTVRNILITFFAITVGAVGGIVVFLFASQVVNFSMNIFREVFFRVL